MTDCPRFHRGVAVLALTAALAAPAFAQNPPDLDEGVLQNLVPLDSIGVGDLFIDFSVPDLAAYTLLGMGTNQITRPKDFRSLGASILDAVTIDGEDADGIGVEVAPFRTILRPPRNIVEYRNYRLLYRLTTSLASVSAEENTRLAFGFRWVPIDHADPLLDSTLHAVAQAQLTAVLNRPGGVEDLQPIQNQANSLYEEVLRPALGQDAPVEAFAMVQRHFPDISIEEPSDEGEEGDEPERPAPPTEAAIIQDLRAAGAPDLTLVQLALLRGLIARYENVLRDASPSDVMESAREAIRIAREDFRRRNWNALAVQVAAGITGTAPGSVWEDLRADQFSAFAGVALPACRINCQFIAQGRLDYAFDDEGEDDEEPLNFGLGARMLVGTDAVHFSLEGIYNSNLHEPDLAADVQDEDEPNWRVTLGAEFRLASGMWLEVATGLNLPEGEEGAQVLTLGSLKYGFRDSSRFNTGQ